MRQRIGVSQHHRLSPWTDFVEVYWHQRGQAYVTPSAGDEINVVVMGNKENLRMSDAAAIFPALWERLKAAQPRASPQSGVTASFVLNSVISERIALVGDASGSVDAITGDGPSLAFRQALALGNALVNNR